MSWTKGLNVEIGADVTKFEQSIEKLNKQTSALTRELNGVNRSLKFDTKNPTLLAQKQQILNERYTATNSRLGELQGRHKLLTDEYNKGNISQEEYNEQMKKQGIEITKTESMLKGFGKQISENDKLLLRYSGTSGKAIANLEEFGDKAEDTSKKLGKYSLAATALLGGMAKVAMDFESSFANVHKTMSDDVTPEKLDAIKKGVIDLSKAMPTSAANISEVVANASQMGVAADDVLEFSETMIKMGIATNLSADVAATSLARFNKVAGYETHDSVDRLGSVIVEMGNNFETTESEIMDMSMRLVAAGRQTGMTRAEILALSTSLTSMGISAEAGGTAFSKVLYNMNDAVFEGGKNLEIFAKTAGMSSSEFAKAFGESAPTALAAFLKGLDGITQSGGNAKTVLEELGMNESRLTSGVLSASGAHESLTKALNMSNDAWEENIALNNEYNVFADTTENRVNLLKNKFMALAIEMGENLLPHIENFANWLGDLIDKFGNMDEGTQKFILSLIGITAVAAPAVGALGKLAEGSANLMGGVKVAGTALGLFGKATVGVTAVAGTASTAVAGVGTAGAGIVGGVGAGAGALSGVGAALGTAAVAAAPFVAVAAAVAATGYVIHKGMTQEAVPAVNLFADSVEMTAEAVVDSNDKIIESAEFTTTKISETTQENVGKYLEMSDNLQLENLRMFSGITEVTEESLGNLKDINAEATAYALEQGKIEKDEKVARYQEVFDASTTITQEQKDLILQYTDEEYSGRAETMTKLRDELAVIYDAIATQGGNATQSQKDRINQIQEEQRKSAISILSETEAEAAVINNRMKEYGTRMTAEQASQVVKEYNTMRDETIAASEAQRDATVKLAEEMRAKNPAQFGKMADEMIKEANRMHTDTVKETELLRINGLEKLEKEYGNLSKDVNLATGNISTWWDRVKNTNSQWNALKYENKTSTVTTYYHDSFTRSGSTPTIRNNGILRVPYDGFLMSTHKGERLLKKHEADQLDRQGYLDTARNKINGSSINSVSNIDNSSISNNFNISDIVIREEADVDRLVNAITRKIDRSKK